MAAYKILSIVSEEAVPDWQRKAPKWQDLINVVLDLKPGQTLPIEFDDWDEAERGRNAVRDGANLAAKAIILRTRLVQDKGTGKTILYLMRIKPH